MPKIQPSPPCQVCGEVSVARKLCEKHYRRYMKLGDPNKTKRPADWGKIGKHPLYHSWKWMERTKEKQVPEWKDFWTFVSDVGERPTKSAKLSRYDAGKPFGPSNCYWGEPIGPLPTNSTRTERAIRMREYRRHNVLQFKQAELKRGFNLTIAQYDAMLEAQGCVCAICGNECPNFSLAVDHCHETNEVRGLLCASCNLGLGKFGDDPARLEAAAAYLRKAKRKRFRIVGD